MIDHAMPLPPTSLIICTRNRPDLLWETVQSILAAEQVPTELIIVDQSAHPYPRLKHLVAPRGCEVRYMHSATVGLSRATNIGWAAARYELVVFTHDDVLVTPTWLATLASALVQTDQPTVVTGQVRPAKSVRSDGFVPSTITSSTPATYQGRIAKDVLYPMNMAFYRSTLTDIGGFDERLGPGTPFPAAEDNDFAFRLLEAGYRIQYVPEAVVYHRAWRSNRDYLALRWGYGRGQGAFYAKHLSLHDRFVLKRMGRSIFEHMYYGAMQLRSDQRRAIGNLVNVGGLVSGAVQWLGMRWRSGHPRH